MFKKLNGDMKDIKKEKEPNQTCRDGSTVSEMEKYTG